MLVYQTVCYDPFIKSQIASHNELWGLMWCKFSHEVVTFPSYSGQTNPPYSAVWQTPADLSLLVLAVVSNDHASRPLNLTKLRIWLAPFSPCSQSDSTVGWLQSPPATPHARFTV